MNMTRIKIIIWRIRRPPISRMRAGNDERPKGRVSKSTGEYRRGLESESAPWSRPDHWPARFDKLEIDRLLKVKNPPRPPDMRGEQ
ncbi:hypothetical protein ElyMa_006304300 [Elysia marginata]|uniref:Uncharacterized protein n=1 Tax=Elysia marginata TaxID=1093978 RepID=A0AAV4HEM2_9GAST|nr:hypothetical protein ElyMa_006304300 [Elysia marginata]